MNLAQLCTMKNLPLRISIWHEVVKFMRNWEPRWSSMSKRSMTRSMERQSGKLQEDINREMEGVAVEMNIAFKTEFWMSPIAESSMIVSMH